MVVPMSRNSMKKSVAVLFILIFAAAMVHFFYGEDHCASYFPSEGGGFGQPSPSTRGRLDLPQLFERAFRPRNR